MGPVSVIPFNAFFHSRVDLFRFLSGEGLPRRWCQPASVSSIHGQPPPAAFRVNKATAFRLQVAAGPAGRVGGRGGGTGATRSPGSLGAWEPARPALGLGGSLAGQPGGAHEGRSPGLDPQNPDPLASPSLDHQASP